MTNESDCDHLWAFRSSAPITVWRKTSTNGQSVTTHLGDQDSYYCMHNPRHGILKIPSEAEAQAMRDKYLRELPQ